MFCSFLFLLVSLYLYFFNCNSEFCEGPFDEGVSKKVLFKNLEEICKRPKNIYVCGGTKVAILRKIATRHIINLEFQDDCPPFHKLTASSNYCMHHVLKFCFSKYSCALNNAFKLKTWLNTRGETQAVEEFVFEPPINLCDEQYSNSTDFISKIYSRCWSLCGRSNLLGLDETDSFYFQPLLALGSNFRKYKW